MARSDMSEAASSGVITSMLLCLVVQPLAIRLDKRVATQQARSGLKPSGSTENVVVIFSVHLLAIPCHGGLLNPPAQAKLTLSKMMEKHRCHGGASPSHSLSHVPADGDLYSWLEAMNHPGLCLITCLNVNDWTYHGI
jgi:hypothetical protein